MSIVTHTILRDEMTPEDIRRAAAVTVPTCPPWCRAGDLLNHTPEGLIVEEVISHESVEAMLHAEREIGGDPMTIGLQVVVNELLNDDLSLAPDPPRVRLSLDVDHAMLTGEQLRELAQMCTRAAAELETLGA